MSVEKGVRLLDSKKKTLPGQYRVILELRGGELQHIDETCSRIDVTGLYPWLHVKYEVNKQDFGDKPNDEKAKAEYARFEAYIGQLSLECGCTAKIHYYPIVGNTVHLKEMFIRRVTV